MKQKTSSMRAGIAWGAVGGLVLFFWGISYHRSRQCLSSRVLSPFGRRLTMRLLLVPIQAIGLVFIFAIAWWLGKREERRLGLDKDVETGVVPTRTLTEAEKVLRRPQNFWINIVLTLVVMATMVALGDKLAPAIVFMVGTCLALLINYRDVDMQRQRIDAHARAALLMASILLAAGVFTGIRTSLPLSRLVTILVLFSFLWNSTIGSTAALTTSWPFRTAAFTAPLKVFHSALERAAPKLW